MAAKKQKEYLRKDSEGNLHCWWCEGHDDYLAYHNEEWGRPTVDDVRLFEKVCLEGFQSGLSWLTILRKRDNFRKAFKQFDFHKVARFSDTKDVARLLQDPGIVRHRGKIEATINNARRALEMLDEFGSLASYFWSWEPANREKDIGKTPSPYPVPNVTRTSTELSKDLKKRGWKFFGPTTAYAFMQAMGLVNDHLPGCWCFDQVELERKKLKRP